MLRCTRRDPTHSSLIACTEIFFLTESLRTYVAVLSRSRRRDCKALNHGAQGLPIHFLACFGRRECCCQCPLTYDYKLGSLPCCHHGSEHWGPRAPFEDSKLQWTYSLWYQIASRENWWHSCGTPPRCCCFFEEAYKWGRTTITVRLRMGVPFLYERRSRPIDQI